MRRIVVVSGEPGTGKSRFCFDVEEPILMWDMENKNEEMQKEKYPDKLITRKDMLMFDDGFHEDFLKTYHNLKKEIDDIIEVGKKVRDHKMDAVPFEWLIVDGISFIRNKCVKARWLELHPNRKNPRMEEYTQINDITRDLLFPLVNMTVAKIIPNLAFTAELQDDYQAIEVWDESKQKDIRKEAKIGRKPAYSDFVGYKLYTLINMFFDEKTNKYKAKCIKSLNGRWIEDVTNKSLYEVLLEKGL